MITLEQEKRIKDYLIRCGLAINIMLEIKDHMISQLNELMFKGKNFEDAFDEVKKLWKPELTPARMFLFSAGRMPKIQKKMINKKSNIFWMKAISFSFTVLAFFMALGKTVNKEVFTYFYKNYYILAFAVVSYVLISNYRVFILTRKFRDYKIAASQYLLSAVFTGFIYILIELISFDLRPGKFYENINSSNDILYAPFLWILIANAFLFYGILAFLSYKRDVKSVEKYLKVN